MNEHVLFWCGVVFMCLGALFNQWALRHLTECQRVCAEALKELEKKR